MGKLPRKDAIERLYRSLAKVPSNIASLTVGTDGSLSATFWPQAHLPEAAPVAGPPPKVVPGTIYPDDDSPISVADLTLNPIDLSDEAN